MEEVTWAAGKFTEKAPLYVLGGKVKSIFLINNQSK